MKIFFLTNDAREQAGGAFHSQRVLIEALNQKGHNAVMVATKKRGGEKPQPFEVQYLDAPLGDLGKIFQLAALIRREKPDVVIANMKSQIVLIPFVRLLTFGAAVRYFGIFRMGDYYLRIQGKRWAVPGRWIIGRLFGALDGLISISRSVSDDLQRAYFLPQPTHILYNPFELETIRAQAEAFNYLPPKGKKLIVNTGRLVEQKAQHHLIELAKELKKVRDDWHLLIIGEGKKRAELEALVDRYGLWDHIELMGYTDNPFPYMKAASVFVLSSLHEGFGRVVAESMALDVPVVGFRSYGGHVELLEEGRGSIVGYGDIPALACQVGKLLDDGPLREQLVEKAGRFVRSLTPESRVQALLDVVTPAVLR